VSGDQNEDKSQKTEQPTPKKLEEAKKKGNIALSKELTSFLLFVIITVVVSMIFPSLSKTGVYKLEYFISKSYDISLNPEMMHNFVREIGYIVASLVMIPLVLCVLSVILANIMQVGIMFVPDLIQFKLDRISLFAGFKRIFSMNSVVELIKGMFKIAIISFVIYLVIKPDFAKLNLVHTLEMNQMLAFLNSAIKEILIAVCIIMAFIAAFDFFYQKQRHLSNLMMSKEEIKKEYKETEGDPQIKSKLKSIRRQRAKQRMMSMVPKADVVITNPTHYAIALQYSPKEGMSAPIVVAKGLDNIALTIRKIAIENNIHIVEDPPLAQALYKSVEIDEEIPFEHYKSIAKIITEVMKLKGKKV
jgi:flagellar biosynthetic protein FlhB